MIIRKEQFDAFEEAMRRNFENEMIGHIKKFAPARASSIGDEGVRDVVVKGVDQAELYDFDRRGSVCLFIEMMFMLGSEFDTDPQYPWAAEILGDAQTEQMDRADRLYDKLMDYVEKVTVDEHVHSATWRLLSVVKFPVVVRSKEDEEAVVRNLARFLGWLYPEKYEYSGEPAMRNLILDAITLSDQYFSSVVWGSVLVSTMMFLLGHQCFSDPQFPWIAETLFADFQDENGEAEEDPDNSEIAQQKKADSLSILIKEHVGSAFVSLAAA